jgi:hypothetical protein
MIQLQEQYELLPTILKLLDRKFLAEKSNYQATNILVRFPIRGEDEG